ncbi:MAG: SRPBCC family protein [Bacteroidales bacterium]|nr:SRPBCC family protein [Bacteroidales bacterium]
MGKDLEYVSKITKNSCQDQQLFDFVSDFRNLASMLPAEVKDKVSVTSETITVQAMQSMSITLSILEKEPYKLLKIGTEGNEMFRIWIQLKQIAPYDTRIRVTLRANVPLIARPMLKKAKLQDFVDNLALALGQIPAYAFSAVNMN